MSFILDALKKLEEKRTTTHPRDILTGRVPHLPAGKRRTVVRLYLLAAVLLAGSGGAVAWLSLRGEGAGRGEVASAGPGVPPPEAARPLAPAPPPEVQVVKEEPLPSVAVAPEPPGDEIPVAAPTAEETPASAALAEPPPEPVPLAEPDQEAGELQFPADEPLPEEEGADEVAPAGDDRLLRFDELPETIRKALQDLRMSGHVYSDDPDFRMASINDKVFREGESISPGLTLEEINSAGAIFTYGGYRFSLSGY